MEARHKKIIIISVITAIMLALVIISSLIFIINGDSKFDVSKSNATLTQTPDYGENYLNGLIFLTDRSISGMRDLSELRDSVGMPEIWTGSGGSLMLDSNTCNASVILSETGEELLIPQALEQKKPRYIVIALGFENGVPYCEKDAFCNYYDKLISAVEENSPDTKIILQSILPVTSKFEFVNSEYSNDKIDTCNAWICELAEKHNVRFLNTAESLKNGSGKLEGDFAGKDSTLNTEGYKKMLEYVRVHGYKEPQADSTQAPAEPSTEQTT